MAIRAPDGANKSPMSGGWPAERRGGGREALGGQRRPVAVLKRL